VCALFSVGIHYRNSYTGECPYKFTTTGLLPWASNRNAIYVLLTGAFASLSLSELVPPVVSAC
jgi:hypothetical protein